MSATTNATANGEARLAFINEHLAQGRTVYLSTVYTRTRVSPNRKHDFKVDKHGHLLLRMGKHYVDVQYCKLTATA
jgi:hypothetical protein